MSIYSKFTAQDVEGSTRQTRFLSAPSSCHPELARDDTNGHTGSEGLTDAGIVEGHPTYLPEVAHP